jgi:periplasmic protein TonB
MRAMSMPRLVLPLRAADGEGDHPKGGGGANRACSPSTVLRTVPLPTKLRFTGRTSRHARLKAVAAVILLHLLLGYAFIVGLRADFRAQPAESLKLFEIRAEPPPPPVASVPLAKTRTPEGAASPPSRKASPAPIVVPPPEVTLPAPPVLPVAEKAAPLPPGADRTAGVSPVDGPGSGTGGAGAGLGSGGSGSGLGGGGARRAERLGGRIENGDYPRAALRARVQGSVRVRYTVGTRGLVTGCTVTRSSGSADLDAVTCRLIERRFRYRPATDASGRPVPETVGKTYDWLLP